MIIKEFEDVHVEMLSHLDKVNVVRLHRKLEAQLN